MKEPSPKVRMSIVIVIAVIIIVVSLVLRGDMLFGGTLAAIMLLIYGIPSIIEKQNDKKSAIPPSEAEVRRKQEQLLKYKESFEFELPVKDNMKDDMKRFYSNLGSYLYVLMGVGIVTAAFFLNFSYHMKFLGVLVAVLLVGIGISSIFALPVRGFIKKEKNRLSEIEDAYMSGKIISNNKNAVNISDSYIITINNGVGGVSAHSREEISSVDMLKQRTKNYENGVYMGDTYQFYIVITDKNNKEFKVELGELKMQIAFEELQRQGYIENL